MSENRGDRYAHTTLWQFEPSNECWVASDLEVIRADISEDALQQAHKMLDKYHRLIEPGAYIEVACGVGPRDGTDDVIEGLPDHPEYEVTAEAIADGERLGLTGNIEAQIQQMCRLAAPPHPARSSLPPQVLRIRILDRRRKGARRSSRCAFRGAPSP